MYKKASIAVVVPAYNEEIQAKIVVETMPGFVDKIIVVDDGSSDKTHQVIAKLAKKNKKIILIKHKINQGVGGAIASGYKWARDNNIDVCAVMSGDNQVLPEELPQLIEPVINGEVDYTKANRLLAPDAFKKIPTNRFIGNAILSFMTKIASGYWHIADSQAGFTAINKKMMRLIDWDKMYKRYGQPNDLLVRLNVYNAKVRDVTSTPVYRPGDVSGIQVKKVIFTISFLLLKMFLWRLKEKYIKRDFHPLILFYFFGFFSTIMALLFLGRWIYIWQVKGGIPGISFLAFLFSVISAIQFFSFAMWFDMEYNKDLR